MLDNFFRTLPITQQLPPSELHHYTTQTGLLGILKEDKIWATRIQHLNDSTEFQIAVELARKSLEDRLIHAKDEEVIRKLEYMLLNLGIFDYLHVCVASFTEERDLLSQWRAYSGGKGGFSISFKSAALVTQAESHKCFLAPCIYKETDQRAAVEAVIEETLGENFNTDVQFSYWLKYHKRDEESGQKPIGISGIFSDRLSQIAPLLKHKAFEEEKEWRLVIPNDAFTPKNFSFRASESMLIPFLAFPLGEKKSDYLESITVGPTPHMDLAVHALNALISTYKHNVGPAVGPLAKTFISSVPYRAL